MAWDENHEIIKRIEAIPAVEWHKPLLKAGVAVNQRKQRIVNMRIGNHYNPYRFFLSQDEKRLLRAVAVDVPYWRRGELMGDPNAWQSYLDGGPYNQSPPAQWLQDLLHKHGLLETVLKPNGEPR